MIGQETPASRIEEITNHLLSKHNFDEFDVKKSFEKFFGEGNVDFIYPKNLFEKESEDKIFYVFHKGFLSEVTRTRSVYEIVTHPLKIASLRYQGPESTERDAVSLELQIESGLVFIFDSSQDNNEPWRRSFSTAILEIYKSLIS